MIAIIIKVLVLNMGSVTKKKKRVQWPTCYIDQPKIQVEPSFSVFPYTFIFYLFPIHTNSCLVLVCHKKIRGKYNFSCTSLLNLGWKWLKCSHNPPPQFYPFSLLPLFNYLLILFFSFYFFWSPPPSLCF